MLTDPSRAGIVPRCCTKLPFATFIDTRGLEHCWESHRTLFGKFFHPQFLAGALALQFVTIRQKINLWIKRNFWTKIFFLDQKFFLDQIFFGSKNFSGQKLFWTKIFFGQKFILTKKKFWTKIFLRLKNFFGINFFSRTKNFPKG